LLSPPVHQQFVDYYLTFPFLLLFYKVSNSVNIEKRSYPVEEEQGERGKERHNDDQGKASGLMIGKIPVSSHAVCVR
jgi:hypothetical protein